MKTSLALATLMSLGILFSQGSASPPAQSGERCDARDNDGDGRIDEGFDRDGDGWMAVDACRETYLVGLLDCDDGAERIHPEGFDRCGDGEDGDCSGADCPREGAGVGGGGGWGL